MSDRAWLGAIYIKDEGGHRIILRSLDHYERRLKSIGKSPELRGAAAMFASVLHQQAVKAVPEIVRVRARITDGLAGRRGGMMSCADDIPFMEKALLCYKADILKARDTGDEYFVALVGGLESEKEEIEYIDDAHRRIKEFE